jgi:hypothetical protein
MNWGWRLDAATAFMPRPLGVRTQPPQSGMPEAAGDMSLPGPNRRALGCALPKRNCSKTHDSLG